MELRVALSAAPPLSGCRSRRSLSPWLKILNHIYPMPSLCYKVPSMAKCHASMATSYMETSEVTGLDWENLGFGLIETYFMCVAKCGPDGIFSKGEVLPFGPIALSPAGVLNYGGSVLCRESSHPVSYLYLYWIETTITWQLGIFEGLLVLNMLSLCYSGMHGLFEGLKAYRKTDGFILLFRPEENAIRI